MRNDTSTSSSKRKGLAVLHRDLEHGELPGIARLSAAHGVVGMADGPQVLDAGLLEIRQIGRMVDDAHRVGLGETGAQPVGERVVRRVACGLQRLAGHGCGRTPPPLRRRAQTPCRVGRPAAARGQPVDPVLAEDGELALGFDRHHASLHDATLAEDAAFGHLGHPALEHGFLPDERGAHVAHGQRYRRTDRAHDRIGRREDDVEGGDEHRAVHAAGRALVGDVEDPAAEGLRRLEVEDER